MFELKTIINDREVEIRAIGSPVITINSHDVMALGSRIFNDWKNGLDEKFIVHSIFIQAVDFRGKPSAETVMFIRMKVDCANLPYPAIVELRGNTVVMLPVIMSEGIAYTILVSQPRIATGEYQLLELPAGMIDNGSFAGAAARELEEELGLKFSEEQLIDMTKDLPASANGIYFSPGMLDEKAKFYLVEIKMTREQLNVLKGKVTGVAEEGEQITLIVQPLSLIPAIVRDGKTFIALTLYHQLGCK